MNEVRRAHRGPSRRSVVLATLVLAAATLAAAQAGWVTGATTSAVRPDVPLVVAGHTAAPGATAGALVAAAAALATSLGGRVGTRVAGSVGALGGVLVVASVLTVLRDPEGPVRGAAVEAVGVPVLVGGAAVSPAAPLTLVLGLLLCGAGALTVAAARRWSVATGPAVPTTPVRGGPAGPAVPDDRDSWDALTRGEDPT